MYKALSPGAIGVRVDSIEAAVAAAKVGGFGGVEVNPSEVASRIESEGLDAVRALFESADIKPAAWGLPTDWRTTEDSWRSGLAELPRLAKAMQAIGCSRTATWILPMSNDLNFDANRRFHIERFKPIASILGDHGIHLGLEFIGPKTLRDSACYPFIYTAEAMLEMGRAIGPNVGLLLDCWHWYTSGGTLAEIRAMVPDDVVYVHVNDAPAETIIHEQRDNVRCLPGETGVIDIAGFLTTLAEIGYDGPVTPEPFKNELNDLPSDEERLELVGKSMETIFESIA